MKTINKDLEGEIIIKNSRFISLIYRINSSNIDKYLNKAKELYPKATHYTYGYIYNDIKRCNDDGEPTGTAGMPILNVLEKENLNNILVIVVRYFGGVKLGAGGLIRAYTKSVTEVLKNSEYIELINGYKVEIIFPYNEEKQVNYILNNSEIINKEYNEDIKYTVLIDSNTLEKLDKYNIKVLEDLYIEKKNS